MAKGQKKQKADKIDPEQVEKLAMMGCKISEIAAFFDVNRKTIERNFGTILKKGKEKGKMSLRRKQYEVAMRGNVSMLIWLGKQMLDQCEKADIKEDVQYRMIGPKIETDDDKS